MNGEALQGQAKSADDLEAVARSVYASHLQTTSVFWTQRRLLTDAVLQSATTPQELEQLVLKTFHAPGHGFRQQVENFTSLWHRRLASGAVGVNSRLSGAEQTDTALESAIQAVNKTLDTLVRRRLNRMSVEMNAPLARRRTLAEEAAFMDNNENEYTVNVAANLVQNDCFPSKGWSQEVPKTCLYDDVDLLDAIRPIKVRPTVPAAPQDPLGSKIWSSLSVDMDTRSLEDMRLAFRELHPVFKHVGLDDGIDPATSSSLGDDPFLLKHVEVGLTVLASASSRVARQYAKQGIPANLRPKVWDLIMQSDMTDCYAAHVRRIHTRLKVMVSRHDLLVDRLIQLDAKHAGNDDGYFVFEDMVRDVLLLWTRDVWLQRAVGPPGRAGTSSSHPKTDAKGQYASTLASIYGVPMSAKPSEWTMDNEAYPPNGILPFWGISLYAMPVCFLHETAEHVYMTFRELYSRYFFNLHTISSQPGTLLHLCATFQNLLKQADALVYFHLSTTLSLAPLDLAFKWMLYAFVGVLDCEQVLLLWDRILAYDSLELLPLTAVALIVFRRDLVLQSQNSNEIEACFSDLSMLKWVPLVQQLLFHSCDSDVRPTSNAQGNPTTRTRGKS
ncbi:hypothetical protein BC831DRAFT_471306 [Entophlyctis helioformis]|nr:hypothetical protein BC831DRAFT_471306 [Entophlyctis helioformis]